MNTHQHQEAITGEWQCLAVGKNNVRCFTVRDNFKACGHCMHFILDANGNKQVWTMREQLIWKSMVV